MTSQLSLSVLAIFALSLSIDAQEMKALAPVEVRAVLHDPVNPSANLFYADKTGAIVKLNFRPQDLTPPLFTVSVNGSLMLYDKAEVDPDNPAANLAASAKLPEGVKQVIVVVIPAPPNEKPAYRMLVIDDSEKSFPKGESLALSLVGVGMAIEAGEHKLLVHPGKMTKIPPVRKVNEYNMAQTNFYYQKDDSWIAFTERQLQYVDACRRIFIIHSTPAALQPTVTTIVDTSTRVEPH
jgi:hypothetical protein